MAWSEPVLELIQSHSTSVREAFDAAALEITAILTVLDEFEEIDGPSQDQLAEFRRKLARTIRDIPWTKFEGLEFGQQFANKVRLRSIRQRLISCVASIAESANLSSESEMKSALRSVASQLLDLRRSFAEESMRVISLWSWWAFGVRSFGVAIMAVGIFSALFFAFYNGVTTPEFLPLSPSIDYLENDGTLQLKDHARKAIIERFGTYFANNGLATQISSVPHLDLSEEKLPEFPLEGAASSMRLLSNPMTKLSRQAVEASLRNRSFVSSEYLRQVVCSVKLIDVAPFPWKEAFPVAAHQVTVLTADNATNADAFQFSPCFATNLAAFRNEAHAPVLVKAVCKVGQHTIAHFPSEGVVIGTASPIPLVLDTANWTIEPSAPSNAEPSPAPPPPGISTIPSQSPESTPSAVENSNVIRLPKGSNAEIEWTSETINGEVVTTKSSFKLPDAIISKLSPHPCPAPAFAPGVAALFGKVTSTGDQTIHVKMTVDTRDMAVGEMRTAVISVDRFLAPRGYLSVQTQFDPTMGGQYEITVTINNSITGRQKVEVLYPEIGLTLPLTVERFRTIQQSYRSGQSH